MTNSDTVFNIASLPMRYGSVRLPRPATGYPVPKPMGIGAKLWATSSF
jgi:hypothetical protein